MSLTDTAIGNDAQISKITFQMRVHSFCAIGKDHFTNNIEVTIVPNRLIPDYTVLEKRIKELEGQENNVEAVVAKVFNIVNEVKPHFLTVTSCVDDADTHFPVCVTKNL